MPTRVVVAEDEAIIRMDLRELLQEEGYEVVAECGRGDEAVELVREHAPDVALLDIKMPGLDGISAAREIASERLTAVVLVTGFWRGAWLTGVLAGLSLAMALMPNEFPVVLTIFLSLGAWRLSKRGVLARRMPAVEALGAVTVLCVDKNGTLTQSRTIACIDSGCISDSGSIIDQLRQVT